MFTVRVVAKNVSDAASKFRWCQKETMRGHETSGANNSRSI